MCYRCGRVCSSFWYSDTCTGVLCFCVTVFVQAPSGSSVTIEISNSGDKTNPVHNPFGVNTTDKGNASVPIFGSTGNLGHTPFPVNTNGNATSASGNMTNSAPNNFAVNITGNGSMSAFGNPNHLAPNSFAINSGNGSMSAFGNPNNLAPNSLAVNRGNESMSAFGNMTNSTHNPFVVNTSGNASMSVPGIPYNPASNLFASNTNGNASLSAFGNMSNNSTGNASVSVFGNPTNPTPKPFALNANGNASMSIFGNPSNPPPNPCAFNTNGNASMSAFGNSSNPPPNPLDGTSTGAFGAQPFSVLFGVAAAPTGTSGSPAAFTNHMRNNAFDWGPGGSAPASFSQPSGSNFGQPSNALLVTKGHMTSTSAGVTQACTGMNKGSKSVPYAATKNAENSIERFLSISSMPVYQSKCHEELRWEDYELKSRGNHGGSTDKAVDSVIAVKDPFGPQTVSSHPLTDHLSCMPVITPPLSYTRVSPRRPPRTSRR